jgi:hypothetical protein
VSFRLNARRRIKYFHPYRDNRFDVKQIDKVNGTAIETELLYGSNLYHYLGQNDVEKAINDSFGRALDDTIDDSDYCVFYYKEDYKPDVSKSRYPSSGKSGTKIAFDYATSKSKQIINVADEGG